MQISYYKKPLILVAIYYIFGFTIWIVSPPTSTPYTPLIVIDDAVIETLLLLVVIYPLSSIIGSYLIGYLLVPIFLFIHVKIYGKKLEYGIVEKETPTKFNKSFRGFFPILLAVNLTLILASNQNVLNFILYPDHQVSDGINAIGVVFLLMFTVGIGMGLFSTIWFLNDAGIIYSNKKKVEGTDNIFEVRSMGSFFKTLLKGYAGISVVISFINYIFFYAGTFEQIDGLISQTFTQIAIPLLLACCNALSLILLDLTKHKNTSYVRKIARKFGVVDSIEVSFVKKTI